VAPTIVYKIDRLKERASLLLRLVEKNVRRRFSTHKLQADRHRHLRPRDAAIHSGHIASHA
ncbi:hypothetical protein ACC735_38260, partial [Rhizobium ruizarguesonis]